MGLPPAQFATIDGVSTPRPQGQNIKPKAFKDQPFPLAMIAFTEPTDRYVLWFVHHYKYAFNVFYTSDFCNWLGRPDGDMSKWPLYKHQIVLKSLMDRHMIKHGDKQRLTLVLTRKGMIYRLTSHPAWPIIPVLFAALVAFTIFGLNKGCTTAKKQSETEAKNTNQIADSALHKPVQIQPLSQKDSVSSNIDTTKTQAKDSL